MKNTKPRMDSRASRNLRTATIVLTLSLSASACAHGSRDQWQQPGRVISSLDIRPGDRVADLGAGDGYFTFHLAEATGPLGTVFAIDVDEEALERIAASAQEAALPQIETVLSPTDDAGLDPASVDLILVCNTYHHIEDRPRYFRRLGEALRPGGRIAIIELDDLPWYHELFHRDHQTSAETIRQEMAEAGFSRATEHLFLEHQSFHIFSALAPASDTPESKERSAP